MYKRIKLAIAIIKTGTSFVFNVKTTLFIPIITVFFVCVSICIYIVGFIYLFTSGTLVVNKYGIATYTFTNE